MPSPAIGEVWFTVQANKDNIFPEEIGLLSRAINIRPLRVVLLVDQDTKDNISFWDKRWASVPAAPLTSPKILKLKISAVAQTAVRTEFGMEALVALRRLGGTNGSLKLVLPVVP